MMTVEIILVGLQTYGEVDPKVVVKFRLRDSILILEFAVVVEAVVFVEES